MDKWIPDRKFIAGGVSGVVAYFAATYTGLSAELAMQITGAVWAAVTYFTPASVTDVLKRIDQRIVDFARDEGKAE